MKTARSASLPLPNAVLKKVAAGKALGPVMSALTGIHDIGQKEGAIGEFTAGVLTRILALSPFHHPLYR